MHIAKHIIIATLSLVVATAASAQQSPLSSLLGNLGKLARSQAAAQASPSHGINKTMRGTGPAAAILQDYAVQSPFAGRHVQACGIHGQGRDHFAAARAAMRQGDYLGASMGYLVDAKAIASCAVAPEDSLMPGIAQIPLEQGYQLVGQALAISVIAAYRMPSGIVPEGTLAHARNAMTLLELNESANRDLIEQLKATGVFGNLAPTSVVDSEVAKLFPTAGAAVEAYKSNTFAFNQQYDGKVIAVSGPVKLINGTNDTATITLEGHRPKDMDTQGYEDLVRCKVVDKAALANVARLRTGVTTTVVGLYDTQNVDGLPGVALTRCHVK